ncbi:MAG: FtsX-like permease family protein, partial [Bacteroidota bacterium]
ITKPFLTPKLPVLKTVFSISIILMISSLVVYHQLRFMQNAKLGFDLVQTLVIDFNGDRKIQEKSTIIKRELLNIPGVKNITASSKVPGREKPSGWSMRFLSPTGDTLKTEVPLYIVDHDFLEQYKIEMLAGRAFSTKYLVDSEETILISEATVKSLGFNNPEEVLGTKVLMYPKAAEVVGIFQDFHYESLQSPIQPLAMRIFPFGVNLFSLQLETSNLQATIAAIERKWKTLAPQRPLSYTFLDEDYNKQYATEAQFGQTLGLFTLFALFIANLGLFGLTLFSVQQRTKEIGTRKVLGASVLDIIKLLTQNFLKLVAIATLLAIPIAWYLMNNWLQNFAYQTEIQWWMFVLVGTVVIAVALLTVSMQSMKAARANPIESLRNE